jgi:uncharacterized protein
MTEATEPKATHTVELFEDDKGEWRWHIRASNGQLIATSGEGFVSKSNAQRAAENVQGVLQQKVDWVQLPVVDPELTDPTEAADTPDE